MKSLKTLVLLSVLIPSFLFAQTSVQTGTQIESTGAVKSEVTKEVEVKVLENTSLQKVIEPVIEPVREILEAEDLIVDIDEKDDSDVEGESKSAEEQKRAETKESIRTVSDSIDQIEQESKIVESEVRAEIKKSIDRSILEIRSQQDIEAYELQRVVDTTRNEIYQDINTTIKDRNINDTANISDLEIRVGDAINDIERSLEEKSGVDVDVSGNIRSVQDTLLRYREVIEEKKVIIDEREGDLINQDTDGDGLSDYDEKFIYNTNPESAFTVEGELTDAEKIRSGINPTSENSEPMQYSDPREDREAVISKIHKVERVELVKDEETQEKRLRIEGTALPNSYVTVYVFSTPTIITVKTDERGQWSYTMDKELETGEHEVFVATVDNTGRLLARSESIPLTQTTEAAALGTFGIGEPTPAQNDFVQENFILIILAILLFAIIITLILSGGKKDEIKEMIDNTKNSV